MISRLVFAFVSIIRCAFDSPQMCFVRCVRHFYNGRILFQVVEQHTEEERPECVLQNLEEATPARGRGRGKGKGKKTKTPAAKEKVVREITIIISITTRVSTR